MLFHSAAISRNRRAGSVLNRRFRMDGRNPSGSGICRVLVRSAGAVLGGSVGARTSGGAKAGRSSAESAMLSFASVGNGVAVMERLYAPSSASSVSSAELSEALPGAVSDTEVVVTVFGGVSTAEVVSILPDFAINFTYHLFSSHRELVSTSSRSSPSTTTAANCRHSSLARSAASLSPHTRPGARRF
jgi:hypothetical protein